MSLLNPVNVCGEKHDKPPVGHVIIPHGAYPEFSSGGSKTHLSTNPTFSSPHGTSRPFIDTGDRTSRTVETLHYAINVGAEVPEKDMNSLVETYAGHIDCWDDAGGAPLDVALLQAA